MADLVSRIYSGFRGVDFRGEEINLVRSPDSLNMWKDYRETESIRTRPGSTLHKSFSDSVYGIFFYKGTMLVHSGTTLYKVAGNVKTSLYTGLAERKSQAFVFDGLWYFKDGRHYLKYDGTSIGPVSGYIPTTTIARKPMGGGTKHEDVNMLSDYRINTFLADGVAFSFFLDVVNIDSDYVPIVKVNGETVATSEYDVNYVEGSVTFKTTPPEPPDTDGQDNVSIQFKKAIPEYRACILESTLLTVFDNRVFFSGYSALPNYLWHSSLNDPSYCSDLDYYQEGRDTAAVKGLVAGNNALWVFREPSDANTTVFYHNPAIDEEYGKIYPSSHSSIATGCVGAAVNFNDDIVFFSERGMEGISSDITTEQVVAHRSSLVDRKMTAESSYRDMVCAEWEGYLLVFIGGRIYVADSRATFTNGDHMEYEWFYWEHSWPTFCATVYNGDLYLGSEDGVRLIKRNGKPMPNSRWTTPLDKFKHPQKLKTTNKRGCVVEATGDITVSVKTEDTAFEAVGTYTGVTDYFVSRIKRKKFKDIQLRFASTSGFSLETVTLECYIGGYIKR